VSLALDGGWQGFDMTTAVSSSGTSYQFNRSQAGILTALLGCLAFVTTGWFMLLFGNDAKAIFFGYLCIAFSGLAGVGWFLELFRQGPAVEINDLGFRDRRYSPDIIFWGDIDRLSVKRIYYSPFLPGYARYLRVFLRPGVKLRRTLHGYILGSLNVIVGIPSFTVDANGLNGTVDELIRAIDQIRPDKLSQ